MDAEELKRSHPSEEDGKKTPRHYCPVLISSHLEVVRLTPDLVLSGCLPHKKNPNMHTQVIIQQKTLVPHRAPHNSAGRPDRSDDEQVLQCEEIWILHNAVKC